VKSQQLDTLDKVDDLAQLILLQRAK
jgi:hypothetical protein